ncbi:DUF2589 domain-containing protein [Prevotella stercorea]|uniref:DUF2589 domain-containing protein n=1 Tax=Leyella stercorea TaxID=363265 RepID=UPI001C2C2FC1|nr:DUF2589 domain-containing protein [Leyella stercorea]MBU9898407.1 DUF2589 domain-containing protein [Leyella stercorea]MBU9946626.1 DUF2589 domain-containing protein [Leyella stercorea]
MALPVDNQESLLQELDFNRILGAPLSACVNAQEEAAQATLQYLNEVVFTQTGDDDSSLEPVTVSFYFESAGQVHRIVMPLLLIVPVPYLQIDRVDLTFQATVTESRMNHDTRKLSLKAKYSAPGDSAEVSKETKAEYMNKRCIDINLSVTSADMPMGISKLLEIFNNQLVEVKPDEPEVLPEPTPAEKPKPTEQPTENKAATPTTPKPEKEEKKEEQKPEEPKTEEVKQPEMKYNILLLGKITNAQKSDILNIVSRYCRSSYKLSPSALNNILKAKKHTIPVEDTQENVKTIIDALKQKKIAASAVEV